MSLLGAGHEVGLIRDDRLDQRRNVCRPILQVGGIEHEDAPAGRVGAALEGVGDAPPTAMRDDPYEGVLGGKLVQHVGGAVAAAVVDHDDLAGVGERQQRFAGLAYELGKIPLGVWTFVSLVTRLTVLSCMLMTSATSRSVSGLRYSTPFSKNSRCRSTMKFITLSIVWRRCSIAWIIQWALFNRWLMKSLFSPWNFFLSRAIS